MSDKTTRREVLSKMLLGGAAAASFTSFEEKILAEELNTNFEAAWQSTNETRLADLKGTIPVAKIGNVELSRMFLGGNMIGGWAHSRDLRYLSDLVKAYHTKDKMWYFLSFVH